MDKYSQKESILFLFPVSVAQAGFKKAFKNTFVEREELVLWGTDKLLQLIS